MFNESSVIKFPYDVTQKMYERLVRMAYISLYWKETITPLQLTSIVYDPEFSSISTDPTRCITDHCYFYDKVFDELKSSNMSEICDINKIVKNDDFSYHYGFLNRDGYPSHTLFILEKSLVQTGTDKLIIFDREFRFVINSDTFIVVAYNDNKDFIPGNMDIKNELRMNVIVFDITKRYFMTQKDIGWTT